MPGEVIDRPNPQPLPSHLPDDLENLAIVLPHETLNQPACDGLFKFRRAASYIAAGKTTFRGILCSSNPHDF
jgi:xylulose-5-phosphate/fructose-6-phosphate phosphoketolase